MVPDSFFMCLILQPLFLIPANNLKILIGSINIQTFSASISNPFFHSAFINFAQSNRLSSSCNFSSNFGDSIMLNLNFILSHPISFHKNLTVVFPRSKTYISLNIRTMPLNSIILQLLALNLTHK